MTNAWLRSYYANRLKYSQTSWINKKQCTWKNKDHPRKETAQQIAWQGSLLSCILSCAAYALRENFATQGREENICHVWYFWPWKADSSPCAVNVWIGLSQINPFANEIGLLAHVISKLKMAETLLSEIMLEESCLCPILVMKGQPWQGLF